jgi:hypothetical protein
MRARKKNSSQSSSLADLKITDKLERLECLLPGTDKILFGFTMMGVVEAEQLNQRPNRQNQKK